MAHKIFVKVLRTEYGQNDHSESVVVDRIQRMGEQVRLSTKRGVSGTPQAGKYRVSYKGETFTTFRLPECYGENSGLCIAVEGWWLDSKAEVDA